MARKARKKKVSSNRNRGGRKPGRWELITPEEIRAFRKANGLSRAKLAGQLKVSTTSIQNWETGRVASRKIQERLRAVVDGRPLPPTPLIAGSGVSADAAITTTGEIVSAFLRTQKGMRPEQLTQLIKSVKRALIS